jgi:hypothetical protein
LAAAVATEIAAAKKVDIAVAFKTVAIGQTVATWAFKKGSFALAYPLTRRGFDGMADRDGKKGPPRASLHFCR